MQAHVRSRILQITDADDIVGIELIQPLWNNYGTLNRVHLKGGTNQSVIVKHIKIPGHSSHPRGFNSDISRDRKVRSYQVEKHWYEQQNQRLTDASPTPRCLDAFAQDGELILLLDDLSTLGFTQRIHAASWSEIAAVLRWLAHFHARFIGDAAEGLWESGTYWHLDTRPEELDNIKEPTPAKKANPPEAQAPSRRVEGFPANAG